MTCKTNVLVFFRFLDVGSDLANVSRWCGQLSQRKAFSTSVADVLGNKDQWKIYKVRAILLQIVRCQRDYCCLHLKR